MDTVKWKNVHIDKLPQHDQEVLLSAGGVYYYTMYDADKSVFRLRDEPETFFVVADREVYYWLEIGDPPNDYLQN
jgi:hypothetical protein